MRSRGAGERGRPAGPREACSAAWMRPGRASDARVVPSAVERLIRENGHIFTEAQCKVCSALLISESQRLAHYQVRERGAAAAARPPPGAAGC